MMITRGRFLAALGAVVGSALFGGAALAQRRGGTPAVQVEAGGTIAHFQTADGERVLMYRSGGAWLADGFAFMPETTPEEMAAAVMAALEKYRQRRVRGR